MLNDENIISKSRSIIDLRKYKKTDIQHNFEYLSFLILNA